MGVLHHHFALLCGLFAQPLAAEIKIMLIVAMPSVCVCRVCACMRVGAFAVVSSSFMFSSSNLFCAAIIALMFPYLSDTVLGFLNLFCQVPIPRGLDLDQWIHEPEPEVEEEPEQEHER